MPRTNNPQPAYGRAAPAGPQKPVHKRAPLPRLCRYLMRFRWWILLALALTLASNLLALLAPMLSGKAIDSMEGGPGGVDFAQVGRYALWMLVFYAASSALAYLLSVTISRKVTYSMRADIFNHLATLPVGYFDTHPAGDILSRISYDTDTINASLSTDLVQVLASVVTVVGSLGMMLAISPPLVLVFGVTVPLSILITRFITSHTRPLFRRRSLKIGQLNGFVEEAITGQKTLTAYCQEENTIRKLDAVNDETVDAYFNAEYYSSRVGPCVNFINNLSLALISVCGALLYLQGLMTVGSISSFVLYSRKFSGPINETANIVGELQSALAAAERVFRLLDEAPEAPDALGAQVLDHVAGDVALEDVSFGYEPGHTILHDLSLHAKPGTMTAIVGPTGAGKTTLVNLLMRFFEINSGNIKIDGVPTSEMTREGVHDLFSMVLQDTWLFEGTVRENLVYNKTGVTDQQLEEACRACGIYHFIETLPHGFDTVLDDSIAISSGQKQLLTIARAMIQGNPMLILDEATSSVDTRTELITQQAMDRLTEHRTSFVIAHRLSTIKNADLILVLKDGDIIEQGTHKELLAKGGFYADLYNSQFEKAS